MCNPDNPAEPPVEPPVAPQPGPCGKADSLINKQAFKDKITELKGKLNLNYETGYYFNGAGNNSSNYTAINGQLNGGSILFNVTTPIDGFLHTHYNGLFTTFSVADLQAIYNLYTNNLINNINSFSATVTTSYGTYTLLVDNINLFSTFGQNNLTSINNIQELEGGYDGAFNTFQFLGNSAGEARELAFLKIIESSGLKFFKANGNLSDFQGKKLSSGGLNQENDNCR